jgi:hypothetical protein
MTSIREVPGSKWGWDTEVFVLFLSPYVKKPEIVTLITTGQTDLYLQLDSKLRL